MPISEVYNCDCMEFMKTLPDKFFDLAIVDPPYGINVAKMAYTQEDNRPCKQKNGTTLRVKKKKYKHGDWDKMPPDDNYFKELFRVSKNQIIWGIDHFNIEGIGNGRIKWNKHVPDGVSFNNFEFAYCSLIDNETTFDFLWAGMCQGLSLKEPTTQKGNKKLNEVRIHPTQKPTALYSWSLLTFAKKGDKIFDSHMGSQGSRIVSYKMEFDYWGCELDEDYFRDGCARFEKECHGKIVTSDGVEITQQKLF